MDGGKNISSTALNFKNYEEQMNQPLQSINNMMMGNLTMPNGVDTLKAQSNANATMPPKGNLYENSTSSIKEAKAGAAAAVALSKKGITVNNKGPNGKNLQKHEIEVMVLSKVDPLNSAFPAGAAESEAALVNPLPQIGTQQVYHQIMSGNPSKRNPFNYKGKSRQTTNLTAGTHESTQKLTSH